MPFFWIIQKWEDKEVTSLVRPGARQLRMERFSDVQVSYSDRVGTINNNPKKVKLSENGMNQLESSSQPGEPGDEVTD